MLSRLHRVRLSPLARTALVLTAAGAVLALTPAPPATSLPLTAAPATDTTAAPSPLPRRRRGASGPSGAHGARWSWPSNAGSASRPTACTAPGPRPPSPPGSTVTGYLRRESWTRGPTSGCSPPPAPTSYRTGTQTIGYSVLGRPITLTVVGSPSAAHRVMLVGAVHGNERGGLPIVDSLAKGTAPRGVAYFVVRDPNPDGGAAHTRQNYRQVDLNRNFPGWRPNGSRGSVYYPRPRCALRARVARDAHGHRDDTAPPATSPTTSTWMSWTTAAGARQPNAPMRRRRTCPTPP